MCDRAIKLWDVETGREIRTFSGHTGSVNSVAFNPDGRQVLFGSNDGTIRIWDIATGREIELFVSFTDGEWLSITPAGYYNASANGNKHLNVRTEEGVFGTERYRDIYFRPDIIEARLRGN